MAFRAVSTESSRRYGAHPSAHAKTCKANKSGAEARGPASTSPRSLNHAIRRDNDLRPERRAISKYKLRKQLAQFGRLSSHYHVSIIARPRTSPSR